MCLAVPARVIEVHGNQAVVSVLGCIESVDIRFTPAAKRGDHVLVHVGFAIQTLSTEESDELAAIWETMES